MSLDVPLILKRLLEIEAEIEQHKAAYAERDLLTLALQQAGFSSHEDEEHTYVLQDNFATTNVAYRAAFVRRFNVKITERK
jgi:hypothetical protein